MAWWERLGLVGSRHSKLWWWPIGPWTPMLSWQKGTLAVTENRTGARRQVEPIALDGE